MRWASASPPARRRAVRRGVGEGGVLRRGLAGRARCRPTVFVPRPKVDSVLVRLRRRAAPPVDGALGPTSSSRSCAAASRSAARCCAARSRRCSATAPPTCSTRAGVAPTARAEALGLDEWAAVARSARRTRHETRPRPGHGVPEAHAVAARARPPRRRLPRPRGAGRVARPAPRRARGVRGPRARWRAGRGRRRRRRRPTSRPTTRNLAFIAAEKLLVRAGSIGSRRAPRAAQADPRGRGPRWRLGRRGRRAARGAPARSTSTSTTTACSRSRPRSDPTCRSACAAARRGCAGAARSSSRSSLAARARVPRRHPAVPAVDARRVPRVGRARRPPSRARGARRRAGSRRSCPSSPTTSSRRPRRSSRGWWSSATRSRPRPARRRCSRAAARPTWCRSPTPARLPGARRRGGPPPAGAGRRHDQRHARRPPRLSRHEPASVRPRMTRSADAGWRSVR